MRNLLKGFFLLLLIGLLGGCNDGGSNQSIFGASPSPDTAESVVSVAMLMYESGTTTPTAAIGAGGDNQDGPADVVARVTKDGAVVPGALVTFTTNNQLATFSPTAGTARTDARGQARITLLAGSEQGAGELTAKVTVDKIAGTGTFVYEVTSPVVGGVTVSVRLVDPATGNDLVAPPTIGRDQSARVIATVIQNGEVVMGAAVNFSTTDGIGKLSETSALTGSNGEAVVDMTAGSVVGASQLTASATLDEIAAQDSIGFIVESTSRNTVNLDVSIESARTLSGIPTIGASNNGTVVVVLTDVRGNPIQSDVMVSFTTSGSIGILSPASATAHTDPATGRATIQLLAGEKLGASLVTARATVGTVTAEDSAGFNVDSTSAGPGGLTVTVSVSPNQIDPLTPGAVVATVRDQNGNAPATPVVVDFRVANSIGVLSQTSDMTNANGNAVAQLTTGTEIGADLVIAEVTVEAGVTIQASSPFEVTSIGDSTGQVPAALFLNLSSTQLPANATTAENGGVTVTAIVTDATGRVVSNVPVTFSLVPPNNDGVLQVTAGRTSATGEATAMLTTGGITTARTLTVSAVVDTGTVTGGVLTKTRDVTVTSVGTVDTLTLLVSNPQLLSNADQAGEGVTLTAVVRDAGHNPVEDVQVMLSTTDSADILVTNPAMTDANGRAEAVLATGGDPTNRTITVTATALDKTDTVTVDVVGTSLKIDGPANTQIGTPTTYTITLANGDGGLAGYPVTVTTENGNQIAPVVSYSTDASGQVVVVLTPTVAASSLTATALRLSAQKDIAVSTDLFSFTRPVITAPDTSFTVPLNRVQRLDVQWLQGGAPVPDGSVIHFASTRGTLSAAEATTTGGVASVTIESTDAGMATVVANSDTAAASIDLRFLASQAYSVVVQADPAVLNTTETSAITATVRDEVGNLVADKAVEFQLTDNTGGVLTTASAITDEYGQARVTYLPGATPSEKDGVIVHAVVRNASPVLPATAEGETTLTVTDGALRIKLVTGNEMAERGTTLYAMPYTAMVTDGAGNPAPDATLRISALPTRYYKGVWGEDPVSGKAVAIYSVPGGCANEDQDLDGVLDTEDSNGNGVLDPGEDLNNNGVIDTEDFNGNGILDPGNVASVPSSPPLGADGTVLFDIIYGQDQAHWIDLVLKARASVDGSEDEESRNFMLPILITDLENPINSPYGSASTCRNPN